MIALENKVAVVTGGSSGIGQAIARVFRELGAIVHVLDIKQSHDKEISYHNCDLSNHHAVGKAMASIFGLEGKLDILVNNAGIAHIGTVESTEPDDLDKIYAVNVRSVYSCSHFAVKHMKESGGGSIVNISSIAAVTGLADRFAYSMSKGAVLTMTYSMAKDLIGDKIRCNAVGPARIHTPFVDGFLEDNYPENKEEMYRKLSGTQPIGRMGTPVEVANLVAYLCSDEASFITGSFYPIDGGFITLNTD